MVVRTFCTCGEGEALKSAVHALGGVFAAGVALRLGSGIDAASRLLAGSREAFTGSPGVSPALFREAIDRSLLPVFVVLLGLAAVNLFFTSGFPASPAPVEDRAAQPADALV